MNSVRGLELDPGDEKEAVLKGASRVSRGELRRRADELLERMRERRAERVLVQSDDPVQILRAVDAVSRAGGDLWIAHTTLPDEFLNEIVEQFAIQVVARESDQFRDATGNAASGRIHMMTSGTTGRPKIAIHTLETLLHRIRASAVLPANQAGKWLLTYQTTGFAGLQVMLMSVLSGGVIVVPEQRVPAGFYEAAKVAGVTQISGTPTFWRSFLMVARPADLSLKQITLGGEAIDQPTLDRVKAAFPDARVTHIYASTEAGVAFSVHDGLAGFPRDWLERPRQGVELRIRDELLELKTPNAMQRYASVTEQPLLDDGWIRTADRCEIHGDRVRILGRQDSTINVGGSKVYPLAIETFLLGLPDVQEARVFGVANPISGYLVAAEVALSPGVDAGDARVRILTACREQLAGYQVPRVFRIVDSVKVAASGKKG